MEQLVRAMQTTRAWRACAGWIAVSVAPSALQRSAARLGRRPARSPGRAIAGVVSAVYLAASISGCTSTNPFTGESETSKTTKGAVLGGLAGAAAGALTGKDSRDRRKRALIGAGIGALAGGAVGRYMDLQEAALRERLARTGVGVARSGDEIQLLMPGNVTFETDRDAIRAEFFQVLSDVALVLNEYEKTLIEITGFTDSTGEDAYNQRLSERRAESVRSYLSAQGVRPVRLVARGLGERMPIASNDTPEGRRQNRRVEIQLIPLTE